MLPDEAGDGLLEMRMQSPERADEVIDLLTAQIHREAESHAAAEAELSRLNASAGAMREELARSDAQNAGVLRLREVEQSRKAAMERKPEIERMQTELDSAERAEPLRAVEERLHREKAELNRLSGELQAAKQRCVQTENNRTHASETLAAA